MYRRSQKAMCSLWWRFFLDHLPKASALSLITSKKPHKVYLKTFLANFSRKNRCRKHDYNKKKTYELLPKEEHLDYVDETVSFVHELLVSLNTLGAFAPIWKLARQPKYEKKISPSSYELSLIQ